MMEELVDLPSDKVIFLPAVSQVTLLSCDELSQQCQFNWKIVRMLVSILFKIVDKR